MTKHRTRTYVLKRKITELTLKNLSSKEIAYQLSCTQSHVNTELGKEGFHLVRLSPTEQLLIRNLRAKQNEPSPKISGGT